MPKRDSAGRSGNGAGKGGALFWNGGEAGVSYALQCDDHGDDLAQPGHPGYPAAETADGCGEYAAKGIYIFELSAVP